MTCSEFGYLWKIGDIAKRKIVRLKDITAEMNVTKVSVFRAVERLERNGYVEKKGDKGITITDNGRQLLEEYSKAIMFIKEKLICVVTVNGRAAEEEAMRIVCVLSNESRGMIVRAWQKREGKL